MFQVICEIMMITGQELPSEDRSLHGVWVVQMLHSNNIDSPKVAKGLITLAILLNVSPDDLILAQELSVELSSVISFEDESARRNSEIYPFINHSTSTLVATSLLHVIESVVTDIVWATMKLQIFYSISQKRTSSVEMEEHAHIMALEETLYSRAEAVATVLSTFVVMNLNGKPATVTWLLNHCSLHRLIRGCALYQHPYFCRFPSGAVA